MLPYRDDNPTENFPIITLLLILVNVFVFLLLWLRPDYVDIVNQYGFTPDRYNFLDLFTSMFLHGGLSHIIFNMWLLWLFGDNLEDKFGRVLFLSFYLLGGLFASFMHSFVSSLAMRKIPCIGASGAISAVMGGYSVLFPRAKLRVFGFLLFYPVRFKLSAFLFFGIWFIGQLFSGSATARGLETTGVAYGAHIGGFLFGAIFSLFLKKYVFLKGHFSTHQESEFEKREEKLQDIVSAATEEERSNKESLDSYREKIEQYLRKNKNDLAVEEYRSFENHFISGVLEANNQKLIADILLERNEKSLALQAYSRFIANYPGHEQISTIQCRLGLLASRDFKNPAEGIKHLRDGLRHPGAVTDKNLLLQANRELGKIESLINKAFIQMKKESGRQSRFIILAQFIDEDLFDRKKIFDTLYSIGLIGERNVGLKLAYNAEHNLKVKNGVILQNLDITETGLATDKLQSAGIPVIALPKENLLRFPGINRVTEASINTDLLTLKTEDGSGFKLNLSDILYLSLGQVSYYIYRNNLGSKSGIFNLSGVDKDMEVRVDDLGANRLLDIFTTTSLRFRVSNLGLNYQVKDGITANKNELFSLFTKDLAAAVSGDRVGQKTRIFISSSGWDGLNFKSAKEFSERALWAVRLKSVYDHLLEKENKSDIV